MDQLSFELISLILDYLKWCAGADGRYVKLAHYSTISRRWQSVVERRLFAKVTVRDLDTFQTIFSSSPYRLAALRQIHLELGRRLNQSAVLATITSLLDQLSTWELKAQDNLHNKTPSIGPIELVISFESNKPRGHTRRFYEPPEIKRHFEFHNEDIAALAKLHCISSLVICASRNEAFQPLTSCQLATHFSSLRKLALAYWDPTLKRSALRKAHRSALAAGINSLAQLPQLLDLTILRTGGSEPLNHGFENASLEDDSSGVTVDLLCEAVRKLAQNGRLETLTLDDELISPDLFRDRRRPADGHHPLQQQEEKDWPSLRRLVVMTGIVAPSGRWYYTGDEDDIWPGFLPHNYSHRRNNNDNDIETSSDDLSEADEGQDELDAEANGSRPIHLWRTRPDPREFNRLAMDLAAAVKRMPRLKTCGLIIGRGDGMSNFINIQYADAGEPFEWSFGYAQNDEDRSVRRWKVRSDDGMVWEVPEELNAEWREYIGPNGQILLPRDRIR